eukprot:TRINITY_DN9525_c0_g1_i4.p1 TRINITY_DN9525_c0_g1~~TRINITY_DN9525_c0_g1_i4.p1  ORF type:complete len:308 (-),score=50.34 TRINITY_DN9525_c0_g1_i4:46-942(-)
MAPTELHQVKEADPSAPSRANIPRGRGCEGLEEQSFAGESSRGVASTFAGSGTSTLTSLAALGAAGLHPSSLPTTGPSAPSSARRPRRRSGGAEVTRTESPRRKTRLTGSQSASSLLGGAGAAGDSQPQASASSQSQAEPSRGSSQSRRRLRRAAEEPDTLVEMLDMKGTFQFGSSQRGFSSSRQPAASSPERGYSRKGLGSTLDALDMQMLRTQQAAGSRQLSPGEPLPGSSGLSRPGSVGSTMSRPSSSRAATPGSSPRGPGGTSPRSSGTIRSSSSALQELGRALVTGRAPSARQ